MRRCSANSILPCLGIVILCAGVVLQSPLPLLSQEASSDALYLVFKSGKWGYADRSGKLVIKPQFESANHFLHGVAKVWPGKASETVFIDKKGIRIGARERGRFREDLVAVKIEAKYGYANKRGDIVIPATFDDADDFSEGLGAVKVNEKWGYIDAQQRMVIAPQFVSAKEFRDGLAAVSIIKKSSDSDPQQGETELRLFDLLTGKRRDEYCGFINPTGEFVVEPQFDECDSFSEGLAPVAKIDAETLVSKWGYIDKTGTVTIPMIFGNAQRFSEGLAPVGIIGLPPYMLVGQKWGYIDRTGRVIIPPQFEYASEFHDGLALVGAGRTVTDFPYRGYTSMRIRFIGKQGYIDYTGEFVSKKLTWATK